MGPLSDDPVAPKPAVDPALARKVAELADRYDPVPPEVVENARDAFRARRRTESSDEQGDVADEDDER